MIYLATPYGHPDPAVRDARTEQAKVLTAYYVDRGFQIFCPIAYGSSFKPWLPNEISHKGWMTFDLAFLAHCEALWVAEMLGWDVSPGVTEERAVAFARGMQVVRISPQEIALINSKMGYSHG